MNMNTNSSPTLPPECFGRALSFLPYSDVRSSSRTGRYAAFQASCFVDTVNIYSPYEMTVRGGYRRYPSVSKVNIFCLQYQDSGEDESDSENVQARRSHGLSVETADRIVPFLASFPHLGKAKVCGLLKDSHGKTWERFVTLSPEVSIDDKREYHRIMKGLIDDFGNAFIVGTIPFTLDLQGLLAWYDLRDLSKCGYLQSYSCNSIAGNNCKLCRKVCRYFPIPVVCSIFEAVGQNPFNFCLGEETVLDLMTTRRDWMPWRSCPPLPLILLLRSATVAVPFERYFADGNDMSLVDRTRRTTVERGYDPFIYCATIDYMQLAWKTKQLVKKCGYSQQWIFSIQIHSKGLFDRHFFDFLASQLGMNSYNMAPVGPCDLSNLLDMVK